MFIKKLNESIARVNDEVTQKAIYLAIKRWNQGQKMNNEKLEAILKRGNLNQHVAGIAIAILYDRGYRKSDFFKILDSLEGNVRNKHRFDALSVTSKVANFLADELDEDAKKLYNSLIDANKEMKWISMSSS